MTNTHNAWLRWGGLAALLAAGAWFAWSSFLAPEPLPPGLVQASGRIEGEHVTVASKVPGRVLEVLVDEGYGVEAGQALARLEDDTARAREDQAWQNVVAMEMELAAFRSELDALAREVPLDVEKTQQAVEQAEATVERSAAREEQAGRDARRYRELARRDTIAAQRREQADLEWTVARKRLENSRHELRQARKELRQARLGRERVTAKQRGLEALRARLEKARAGLDEARAELDDLEIHAPRDGVITEKLVQPGEVVAAGSPLFDMVDLDALYLKAYVPETDIGKIALGQQVRVYADAWPDRHFQAKVTRIADRAEFTPKQVQTRDERTDLVYGVKLSLQENPERRLNPGLPADAVIRTDKDAPWSPPKW